MTDWLHILFNAFWCGCAALGFAILFNSPKRTLPAIYICGFVAGSVKYFILHPDIGGGITIASLLAASVIGFISIPISHKVHVPPIIMSIPAVIPLVPGSFAYRTMLGLIRFVNHSESEVLTGTVHYGIMTLFVIMALSIGVTLPMLLLRIESTKNLRLLSREQDNPS
jgi:uncharacterized membrane protein YjjB (DUF3815 family)